MEKTDSLLRESKVFCMFPWTHMSVFPNGRVLPCCTADGSRPVGNLRVSTLYEVWNSPALREIRLNMMEGRENPHCEKCYEMERRGLCSGRQEANRKFGHHFPVVGSTASDGSVEKLNLPYMDLKFSNLCNFRCRYCNFGNSSAWYLESGLVGESVGASRVLNPARSTHELWRQLEPLVPQLEEIYFAGGEPLIIDDYYVLLRVLAEKKTVSRSPSL